MVKTKNRKLVLLGHLLILIILTVTVPILMGCPGCQEQFTDQQEDPHSTDSEAPLSPEPSNELLDSSGDGGENQDAYRNKDAPSNLFTGYFELVVPVFIIGCAAVFFLVYQSRSFKKR